MRDAPGTRGPVSPGRPCIVSGVKPRQLALDGAQIVDDVPAIHLFDAVVRRHHAATVADHAEDVAVGELLGRVRARADRNRRHAVLRHGSIAHAQRTVAGRAVDLELNAPAIHRTGVGPRRVGDRRHRSDVPRQVGTSILEARRRASIDGHRVLRIASRRNRVVRRLPRVDFRLLPEVGEPRAAGERGRGDDHRAAASEACANAHVAPPRLRAS